MIDTLLLELVALINKIDAEIIFTGKTLRVKGRERKFELTYHGNVKLVKLSHLREGTNPFGNEVRLEKQLREACALAPNNGYTVTGRYKNGNTGVKRFEVTNGIRTKWMTLQNIQRGSNPFAVETEGEQNAIAKELAEKMGLIFTGEQKRERNPNDSRLFYKVMNDKNEIDWTSLSQLRKGHNPFHIGGYDKNKSGYFYCIRIYKNGVIYYGFGITNNIDKRMHTHNNNLAKHGASYEIMGTFFFQDGKIPLSIETHIKRTCLITSCGVEGFISECTMENILPIVQTFRADITIRKSDVPREKSRPLPVPSKLASGLVTPMVHAVSNVGRGATQSASSNS